MPRWQPNGAHDLELHHYANKFVHHVSLLVQDNDDGVDHGVKYQG